MSNRVIFITINSTQQYDTYYVVRFRLGNRNKRGETTRERERATQLLEQRKLIVPQYLFRQTQTM